MNILEMDKACKFILENNSDLHLMCVPGAKEYGNELVVLFQDDPERYTAVLREELMRTANAYIFETDFSVEQGLIANASLIECEATLIAGFEPRAFLVFLFKDPIEFVRMANYAMVQYVNLMAAMSKGVVCH